MTIELTPQEHVEIVEAARVLTFIPFVRAEFDKIVQHTEGEVYRKLDAGTLTPQEAVAAWITKRVIQRTINNLNLRAKMGDVIAEQAQKREER